MSKNIEEKIVDISGIKLAPGKPIVCLGNGKQGLSVVVTSVITFCFVFPNLIFTTKKNVLIQSKQSSKKGRE